LNLPGKWITAILVVVVVCKDEIDLKAYSVVKMIECLQNVVWLAFASVLFKMSFSFFSVVLAIKLRLAFVQLMTLKKEKKVFLRKYILQKKKKTFFVLQMHIS
jgi:hypothetical protein